MLRNLNGTSSLFRSLKQKINGKRGVSRILNDPNRNKGLGFTIEERQLLGIHGLLPARVKTMEEQILFCKLTIRSYKSPMSKYVYLTELSERNERLFYRLLAENIEELMPIVYTPTVGLVCQRFGLLFRRARGLFINIFDKGHVLEVMKNWPEPNVKVIVVTDGERILGLGDLGAHGMGIPVGKLSLYTAFAGINPQHCLPITLDVGTNNKTLLDDPLYVGMRERRHSGAKYEALVDEFMEACIELYGTNVLIQFEDFGAAHAFHFLQKYRNKYCVFNDDIQGTASVALAGLFGASRITKKELKDHTILFHGAGGAANGIALLTTRAMIRQGISEEEAKNKIYMVDLDGLVVKNRSSGDNTGEKMKYAKDHPEMKDLNEIVNSIKPNVLIGVSTSGGSFTPQVLRSMATINERPVIFALSNPNKNAECTPQEAYDNTDGRCVYASGSPFKEVEYNGKKYKTGQGNNCYIFPGVGLGVILARMVHIPEEVFIIAADTIAKNVSTTDLDEGRIFPSIPDIQCMSNKIAEAIMEYAFKNNLASIVRPKDIYSFILKHQYTYTYGHAIRNVWEYPETSKEYDLDSWIPPDMAC